MVEHEIAKEAEFFSFGTNDLAQFLMAADRTNEKLSHYLEQSNQTVVKLIKDFNEAAGKLNMTIEAQYQPATYNRSLGGLATNVIKDFKNFRKLQENSFTKAFEEVTDISVLRGSPEPPEKIESMVAKRIAKGSATIDGRNPKPLTKTKSTRK